jgi:hypothetical protein
MKMRISFSTSLLLIAANFLLMSGYPSVTRAEGDGQSAGVQVYELNPYVGRSYDIVGRLWVGSWRTAFGIPTYSNKDDAIAAMQKEAARLNADALVSVSCLDQHGSTWFQGNDSAFLCYGLAIQLRKNPA